MLIMNFNQKYNLPQVPCAFECGGGAHQIFKSLREGSRFKMCSKFAIKTPEHNTKFNPLKIDGLLIQKPFN